MARELSEQVHLPGVRTVVLADRFPFSESETGVCTHVDVLDAVSAHCKSYEIPSLAERRGLRSISLLTAASTCRLQG